MAGGVLSKLGRRVGVSELTVGRAVCSAAVAGYVTHVFILPALRRSKAKGKRRRAGDAEEEEEEEREEALLRRATERDEADQDKPRRSRGPEVNWEFVDRLRFLLKIIFPRLVCRETLLLCLHTCVLMTRTFLSIYVAGLEGTMVKHIVRKDVNSFARSMGTWLAVAVPATFTNSAIRYLESQLAMAFRSKLVQHAYGLYLGGQTYYRVSNLDSRLENPDHSLTDDLSSFAFSVAHIYSHISKPLLDSLMILLQLRRLASEQKAGNRMGPMLSSAVVFLTGRILRKASPKFGRLVAEEASRKAYLRHIHSRIITNAEEIAFYQGQEAELGALRKAYRSMVRQSRLIYKQKLWYVMLEQFLMKYVWAGTGMVVIALPILTSQKVAASGEEQEAAAFGRTEYYATAKNLLTSGADAMERLMSAYKEIVELAGYTHRVATMMVVFQDCSQGKYKRAAVVTGSDASGRRRLELELQDGVPVSRGRVEESSTGTIALDAVPIVTPNCDVVVPSLTLRVDPGMHLLVSGPNGCGKSSLFRVISGLWPVYAGALSKPSMADMFYIPQRPYMSIGCLRDQVIYPDTVHEMTTKGISDDDLLAILRIVHLDYIVRREGGWGAIGDWKDILSGGEKQRMGMARLFYRQPKFALLDECTSAVSIDVEGKMYQTAKDRGITLLTITHRPSLWKYHTHVLQFDGEGGWKLDRLDNGTTQLLSLSEEKLELEKTLSAVARTRERYEEVCALIREQGQETQLLEAQRD